MTETSTFHPDWVSPPGDTISRVLNMQGLTIEEWARTIDMSAELASALVEGSASIDETIACKISDSLGASPTFWLNRESLYRDDVVRLGALSESIVEIERAWVQSLPLRDMVKFGWVEAGKNRLETVNSLLEFFGVSDVAAWESKYKSELSIAAFRTSLTHDSSPPAVAAWLRRAQIECESIECDIWNPKALRKSLNRMRRLTRRKSPQDFLPELRRLCAECGIALVVAPAPKGCRASGATRFVSPTKALIVLSLRYRTDDHFWFTFFHELGHILLHGKKAVFLEDDSDVSSDEEDEANRFSEEVLIPAAFGNELLSLRARSREIIRFAVRVGVSPGVVVGQLQHKGVIGFNQMNSLKRRYEWAG